MLNEITRISLDSGKREVLLLGTAHVSKKSVELVEETIAKEKPDVVAVELCNDRYDSLINKKRWDETEITKVIKSGKTNLFLMQLLLTNFQRKIGDEIGVKPGSEMLSAIKLAEENKIEIALVDRSITVTLKRAFNLMSLKEKAKMLYSFVSGMFGADEITEETIESLKDTDIITELMNDLGKEIPSIKKVLIDERDDYIAAKISKAKGKKILAVIGAGHVMGIKKKLVEGSVIDDLTELDTVPKKKSKMKYFWYAFPMFFFLILAWGLYSNGMNLALDIFSRWFLINGALSALGAALAFGHPLTIVAAFVAAPFTSLHPAFAAGWFAGLVEIWIRKPKVKDFEGLLKINGIRDLWGNGVTRVLLVIALANVGSSIGTFIALPYLASLL